MQNRENEAICTQEFNSLKCSIITGQKQNKYSNTKPG
jgi:hypothetical protein